MPTPISAALFPHRPHGVGSRRLFLLGCVAAAAACVPLPATAQSPVEVETSRSGELIEVRAAATIAAPLPLIWGTLTDYERLPDFIPGLKKSRVIARNGATTTIEQSGEARFLFMSVPIDVTVESTERLPYLEVRRIAGNLRHLQGRYEVQAQADSALVQLRWTGSLVPETELPPLIGEALVRISIHEQFAGMVREIERREAARKLGLPPPPAGK